ncbi:MAG: hypothetical protein CVU11_07925 [Bacteroidetes bacterium HGW-Bacteroidetes-6]|jgi:hypothetical protein|nr:MAG: hypothetical protein CVU11_07925 [Bacteroidetes bacterium HGW-Bacteroidetes-6]
MKTITIITVFLLSMSLWSCTDNSDDESCVYDDCVTLYPTHGTLTVKVNFDTHNSKVPIQIYSGYYDTGELIREDTLMGEKKDYVLPSGVYYTVAAKYKTDGMDIVVIDGDKIDVNSRKECDSTCYSVTDASINVKLQY